MRYQMRVLDAHCHVGHGWKKKQSLDKLLHNMDLFSVEHTVIVPVEEYIAVNNHEGNRQMLTAVKQAGGRLSGFAVANPWYGDLAVEWIEEALCNGLCGIKLNPAVQGFCINDPIVYPLIEIAEKHNVPVFTHSGTPVTATPFGLFDLAKQFPLVSFIMGHTGYSDFWNDIPYIVQNSSNIWFDTSMSLASRTQVIIDLGAGDRVIFSSNSPHGNLPYELAKVKRVKADSTVMAGILGGNMAGLIGLSWEDQHEAD